MTPHPKLISHFAALALGLAALPAHAEIVFNAEDLLAAQETALGGAIIACAQGAVDPDAANATFTGAGWTKTEEEGSWDYSSENLNVMMWTVPGFCMVADEAISTAEMEKTLLGLTDAPPATGTDEYGCTTYDLGPVVATLTSSGNDPVCTSDNGAALRFSPKE